MAEGGRRSHQIAPPLPPPPYEVATGTTITTSRFSPNADAPGRRQAASGQDYDQISHQTIPKTAHHQGSTMSSMSGYSKTDHNHHHHSKRQLDTFSGDQQHPRLPCAHSQPSSSHHPSRKRSIPFVSSSASRNNAADGGNEQFVRSLVAPRSLLDRLSVEPLAFLAIVALYLEFPAIQDLIWTKICLDIVSRHPEATTPSTTLTHPSGQQVPFNATTPFNSQAPFNNNHSAADGQHDPLLASNSTHTNFDISQLPANGLIQQQSNSSTSPPLATTSNTTTHHDRHGALSASQHLLCDRLNRKSVPDAIRQEIIDADSLFWLKYQILICALCLLASPYWGGLSDKIGRLVPMNVPIVAALVCNMISLVFGLLISLNSHALFHIEWLYLGAIIVGLSGGQSVLIMNVFSFLSDNTTSEERTRRVTVLESVIFVAHSLGFFLSKMIMLLGLDPPDRPWLNRHFVAFAACVLLHALCVLYSMAKLRHHTFHRFLNNFEREQQEAAIMDSSDQFGSSSLSLSRPAGGGAGHSVAGADLVGGPAGERLRELTSSTPDDPDGPIARSDKSNWSFKDTMMTFSYYRETYEIATKRRDTRATILLLLLSGFISSLSLATLMSLLFIYVKMEPFNWSTSQYSWWNSLSSITRGVALVSLTLAMRFYSGWSVPDPLVAALGFLAKGVGLLTLGLAQSSAHLNWALMPFAFSEFSMPPIRSLLSKLVVREELCKIYSCLGALQSFCFILGNLAFYAAFTIYTDQQLFRFNFLVVAAIEFGAVVLSLVIYTIIRSQRPHIL
jgi:hypothetical protein